MDGWFGLFGPEGYLLAAGHSISEREWPQYKILPNGQFSEIGAEALDTGRGPVQKIKVIGYSGEKMV